MHALKQSAVDPPGLRLGSRTWRTIDSEPVRQKAQSWILPQLEARSIRLQPRPGESARDFAQRLFRQVCVSPPTVFLLLGSLLLPAELPDTAWTPALAVRTGKFLSQVWDEQEKEILIAALVSWSLGQAGIDLRDFLGLSAVATRWRM